MAGLWGRDEGVNLSHPPLNFCPSLHLAEGEVWDLQRVLQQPPCSHLSPAGALSGPALCPLLWGVSAAARDDRHIPGWVPPHTCAEDLQVPPPAAGAPQVHKGKRGGEREQSESWLQWASERKWKSNEKQDLKVSPPAAEAIQIYNGRQGGGRGQSECRLRWGSVRKWKRICKYPLQLQELFKYTKVGKEEKVSEG